MLLACEDILEAHMHPQLHSRVYPCLSLQQEFLCVHHLLYTTYVVHWTMQMLPKCIQVSYRCFGSSGLPTSLTHMAFLHKYASSSCRKRFAGAPAFEVPEETGKEIIDKFRLQQGLLLTVRPEQPINLSIEQLRRLSWEEHSGVWRDYVNALAQCLVRLPFFAAMLVSMLHNKSWTAWVNLSCSWQSCMLKLQAG